MKMRTVDLALIIAGIVCSSALGKYGGGTGEPNDPYQIRDANHMQAIGADANDWDKHFKLMADIDLSGYTGTEFNIIGTNPTTPFTGVFDGNYRKIYNFNYSVDDLSVPLGLFAFAVGVDSEIRNLGLIEPNVVAPGVRDTGALVGFLGCTIKNCYVERGSVSGLYNVGGLVGSNFEGTILNCWTSGTVTGMRSFVGGLVGASGADWFPGEVRNCYSIADVTVVEGIAGGLLGASSGNRVSNCFAAGKVQATVYAGGIVGFGNTPTDCFWDIEATGSLGGGGGKTTAEMQMESTFTSANWDFINTWNIGENQTYPYLRTVSPGDINKDHITNFLDIRILCEQWLQIE
ncbi:MAG: GLUG motif-containing protein [Planctomycetota bacterium]|jgi:hypothetical protein